MIRVIVLESIPSPVICEMEELDETTVTIDKCKLIVADKIQKKIMLVPFPAFAKEGQKIFVRKDKIVLTYEPEEKLLNEYKGV